MTALLRRVGFAVFVKFIIIIINWTIYVLKNTNTLEFFLFGTSTVHNFLNFLQQKKHKKFFFAIFQDTVDRQKVSLYSARYIWVCSLVSIGIFVDVNDFGGTGWKSGNSFGVRWVTDFSLISRPTTIVIVITAAFLWSIPSHKNIYNVQFNLTIIMINIIITVFQLQLGCLYSTEKK